MIRRTVAACDLDVRAGRDAGARVDDFARRHLAGERRRRVRRHRAGDECFSGRALDDVLVAFGFDVAIGDPGIFQFVGATVGPLFAPLALGTPMVAGFALNPLGIGPGDFSGALTLATLHFNALRGGGASIGVTWDSNDLNQGLVYLDLPFRPDLGVNQCPVGRVRARTVDDAAGACPGGGAGQTTATYWTFVSRTEDFGPKVISVTY